MLVQNKKKTLLCLVGLLFSFLKRTCRASTPSENTTNVGSLSNEKRKLIRTKIDEYVNLNGGDWKILHDLENDRYIRFNMTYVLPIPNKRKESLLFSVGISKDITDLSDCFKFYEENLGKAMLNITPKDSEKFELLNMSGSIFDEMIKEIIVELENCEKNLCGNANSENCENQLDYSCNTEIECIKSIFYHFKKHIQVNLDTKEQKIVENLEKQNNVYSTLSSYIKKNNLNLFSKESYRDANKRQAVEKINTQVNLSFVEEKESLTVKEIFLYIYINIHKFCENCKTKQWNYLPY
ncbi:hypothetical protein EDEG_02698 [Edhazardia aedis USNM 41457]|uniref:Uncharacterized protein n=1 Tax=Edhazardia aedis (strain USNM 41457) TaxID=1003232 RepID=J9DNE5_EDHAE|nr:hypothetical protein EDEG_02698 [Edhazardia aedis USNM 41457]|eukprot:EJW02912.1 hypothetical protein EDEG_02698 [Edhazardia aedis USNM 41457]